VFAAHGMPKGNSTKNKEEVHENELLNEMGSLEAYVIKSVFSWDIE